jgi:hypothetical protein
MPSRDAAFTAAVFFPITWIIGLIILLFMLPTTLYRGVRDIVLDLIDRIVDNAYDIIRVLKQGRE